MHTSNFYPNFVPIQELSDWFEHWATEGVKPVFTCEYGAPFTWDWAMYRGWYKGSAEFGSAAVPWEFCLAEWNAQFLGDRGLPDQRAGEGATCAGRPSSSAPGKLWHRWDYPHQVGSTRLRRALPGVGHVPDRQLAGLPHLGRVGHLALGARRTSGSCATAWTEPPRRAAGRLGEPAAARASARTTSTSATSGWTWPTSAPTGSPRRPREACSATTGRCWPTSPASRPRFTSKDHNFLPGETVEKQIIVINNSRETGDLRLPRGRCEPAAAPVEQVAKQASTVATGEQAADPAARSQLPRRTLPPGAYELTMTARSVQFSTGETPGGPVRHPRPAACRPPPAIGRQDRAVRSAGARRASCWPRWACAANPSTADADLSGYDVLIVGKAALTADGPAPDIRRVRDGLKVMVFEQTSEALEKRFGFRVQEYGLRQVFPRVPDHPVLAGLDAEHLRDWRGEATILPPRLDVRTERPVQRRADGAVVRPRSPAAVALRQPRQRGLGADREARPRRFPADPRRRLQPAVQPAAGVPRRPRAGAVLPDGRDRADRGRSGRRADWSGTC